MMKRAAEEATLIIPVVILTTLDGPFDTMWAQWTKTLYQKNWKDRIPAVVVTKAAHLEHNLQDFKVIRGKISAMVWGTHKQRNSRVLFCDSLIGLGAMQLGRLLNKCIEIQDQEVAGWGPENSPALEKKIRDPSSPMRHVPIFH